MEDSKTPEVNFKTTTDLVAYFEADSCMKHCIASAQHMGSIGQEQIQAFFIVQATGFQKFIQELIRRNSSGIQVVGAIPNGVKPPGA